MFSRCSATRFLSNSAQKPRKKVDCAVYGCGLSASGALAIPKLIQNSTDDVTASEAKYPKRITYFNTKSIKNVTSGFGFSLFASENRLYGAGINNRFQIGGQLTDSAKFQDYYISTKKINIPAEEILEISSGRAHSLIRTEKGVFAIGDNNFGQCGRDPTVLEHIVGSDESPLQPLTPPTSNPIISIHCSLDTSFLVDSEGKVFSFGLGEDGQCGNETYGIQWSPSLVKGDLEGVRIQKVTGSTDTVMALSNEGEAFVWGQTEYGQAVGATDQIQRKFNHEPPEFVAYADYEALHKHVVMLTDLVNQLRGGLIEEGASKLSKKIATTIEVPDLPTPGPPLLNYHDAVATPGPTTKSFFNPTSQPILSTISTSTGNNSSHPIDPIGIAKQAAQLLEKSSRAVIERCPDDKNPEQNQKDTELINRIATRHALPTPTQFSSKTERDNFIKGFSKIRLTDPDISSIDPKLRVRRDLTRPELETLRTSRKFVYDENIKAKETKYIMVDISYKLNSKPRPFA
ncbi:unnamed protein product [Caenorhabditis nigoni]